MRFQMRAGVTLTKGDSRAGRKTAGTRSHDVPAQVPAAVSCVGPEGGGGGGQDRTDRNIRVHGTPNDRSSAAPFRVAEPLTPSSRAGCFQHHEEWPALVRA
jgi:hypothetical protein